MILRVERTLREEEVRKCGRVLEDWRIRQERRIRRNILLIGNTDSIFNFASFFDWLNYYKYIYKKKRSDFDLKCQSVKKSLTIEMRFDARGIELLRALFEHYHRDIVAQMSFSFNLLRVVGRVRQQSGHVEHQFKAVVLLVYRVLAGGVSCKQLRINNNFFQPSFSRSNLVNAIDLLCTSNPPRNLSKPFSSTFAPNKVRKFENSGLSSPTPFD